MINRIKINCPVTITSSLLLWGFYFLGDNIITILKQIPFFIDFFGNIFIHSSFEHMFNNFKYLILLGPVIETIYGTKNLIKMIFITTLIISSIYFVLYPNIDLIGFSGVVYLFIGLSSLIAFKNKNFPLIGIVILFVFLGDEFYKMVFVKDDVAHLAHILGGIIGVIYGLTLKRKETCLNIQQE